VVKRTFGGLRQGENVAKLLSVKFRLQIAGVSVVALALAATVLGQAPTFKSSTRTVPLYTTVVDGQGRLVPDLVKEDFDILDENKPQEIDLFINEVQPITVVVMLDTSASMTGNLKLLTQAAEAFLMRLLPEDQGRVGAFNDKIQFASEFTSNRDSLIGALKDLDFGNPTRLYDAIDASITELEAFEGRRVVLVFTDGDDTGSRAGSGDVLDRAREKEVMIYAIGLQTDYFNGVQRVRTKPDRSLRKLADETGGGYFELEKTAELQPTFTRVANELHSQYVLGFTPKQLDGKVHRLAVRVKRPGLSARARKSYVAASEVPATR
jgi:Ca-activated chloride channel family protein